MFCFLYAVRKWVLPRQQGTKKAKEMGTRQACYQSILDRER